MSGLTGLGVKKPPKLSTLLIGTSEGQGDIDGSIEEALGVECAII
jgi:hypothetical protein